MHYVLKYIKWLSPPRVASPSLGGSRASFLQDAGEMLCNPCPAALRLCDSAGARVAFVTSPSVGWFAGLPCSCLVLGYKARLWTLQLKADLGILSLAFLFFPSAFFFFLSFLSEEWRSCSLVFCNYIIPLEVLIESWKTTLFEHVYGGNQTRLPLWFAFSYFMLPAFSCGFH